MVSFGGEDGIGCGIVGHDQMTLRAARNDFRMRFTGPMTRPDLLARAAELASGPRRLLGLAGAPGAGKSTLAAALAAGVPGAMVVPMDGFHLTTQRLRELDAVERRGAPDTFDGAGYVDLMRRLRSATGAVHAPDFDRSAEEPVPGAIVVPASVRLVITEGNYLLLDEDPWRDLPAVLDEVWFVEVPEAVRVDRLVARFRAYGWDESRARERVQTGSDARNAGIVAATRERADRVVRLD